MIEKTKKLIVNSRLFYMTKDVLTNPLFSGSATMLIGTNVGNFLAYIYHFIFGRILGPAQYGELASIISVVGILGSLYNFTGLVIIKFTAAGNDEEFSGFYEWFMQKVRPAALILGLVTIAAVPALSTFLHIPIPELSLLAPVIFFSLFLYIYRAFLQGKLQFTKYALTLILEMAGRLLFGLLFVFIGWSVFGVMAGFAASIIGNFFLTKLFVSTLLVKVKPRTFKQAKAVFLYSIPILISSLATISFFSTDILLVKHFFAAETAGVYASLSTLSKVIFYGTAPVAAVMFPIISKKYAQGESSVKIFVLSLLMTLGIAGCVLVIFTFLPTLAIKNLYGQRFLGAAHELGYFGLFITIFSLASLITNYFLSREKVVVAYIFAFFAVVQAVGIWILHSSIHQVITVSVTAATLLLTSLLIYFAYETKKRSLN